MDEVKSIVTLRSGKELKQPATKPIEEGQEVKEAEPKEVVAKKTTMYKQLRLGELKPTSITLSLADRSIKIPKGTVEDVLI